MPATVKQTYPQSWPAYNEAQTKEQDKFQTLLHDLCSDLVTVPPKFGRPRLPLSDALFNVTFKVYSTVSQRRFLSDLRGAYRRGYISKVPHFNSISNYLESPELTPILRDFITKSSLPLRAVESDFAVDSSGFTTCRHTRWFDVKYGREMTRAEWVKCHVMCGVKTNIVTAVEIGDKHASDVKFFCPLVETTSRNFTISEVSADKAYGSLLLMLSTLQAVHRSCRFQAMLPETLEERISRCFTTSCSGARNFSSIITSGLTSNPPSA
jgi:Transposase DDE domain